MARSDFVLRLPEAFEGPLYLAIARTISQAIRSGRLPERARLPGTRSLARQLGVQRNTVVAAYDELIAQGWLQARAKQGTFVASQAVLPTPPTRPRPRPGVPGFTLPAQRFAPRRLAQGPGMLTLSGGIPDLSLVPRRALARAYRRALEAEGHRLLGYLEAAGHPALRAAIADMVRRYRGIPAGPENVMVTRGAQMALYLVAQVLLRKGDRVAVEDFGYPPAWRALQAAGATLTGVAVDQQGLDVAALTRRTRRKPVKAVYVTPHHQYPTMALMSPWRRAALLALAAEQGFAVIEDDYDNEVHYAGQPVLPLASDDRANVVIYVGTLSKVLAPGLRLGYAVAPAPVIEAMSAHRQVVDHQGDHIQERAVAELFEDGEVQRHIRRMHKVYGQRRAVLAEALRRELPGVLEFDLPTGGLALWAKVAPDVQVDEWAAAALARGVAVATGTDLHLSGRTQGFLRLGFAALCEDQLHLAVRTLKDSLPTN